MAPPSNPSPSLPRALILQPSNGGLAVARALGRRGVDVEVLATPGDAYTARTRYARGAVLPDARSDPDAWSAALAERAGDGPVVALAGADEATELLSRRRETLPPGLLVFERMDDVHLDLMDKTTSYALATAAGVRAPWTTPVTSADELEAAIEAAPYPCVLKPVLTHLWRPIFGHDRVLLAQTGAELRAHGERSLGAGLDAIVSEYVPGGDDCVEEAILVRAADGSFPMEFGCQKIRQSPAGFGAASLCVSAPMPESLAMARTLLDRSGFVGVAGIETKRHAVTGQYYFIEVNARLPTQFGLGDACGADASWRTYATLAGLALGPPPRPRPGVRLVFPELEAIELRRFARGQRPGLEPATWGGFFRGYRGVREVGVLDLRDPGPGLAIAGRTLSKRFDRGGIRSRPPLTVTTEVADTPEAIEPALAEWDALAVAAGRPYCAPAWLLAWWKHASPAGARLRVVLVRDGDRLVGVGPFYAEPWGAGLWTWSLLGTDTTSRIEPLADPACRGQVARAIAETLAEGSPLPARIRLEGLPEDSYWPAAVRDSWPGLLRPWHHCEPPTPAPVVQLAAAADVDGWLGTRSSNFRQQMRRARRKLDKEGFTFRVSSTPEEIDRDLVDFERLHNARWDWRGGSTALTPGTDRMLAEVGRLLAGAGRFKLISLEHEGRAVNSQLFVGAGGEISYWNGGFDDDYAAYKPSMVGLVEAIRSSLEHGFTRFDLGPGAQDYKYRFSDSQDLLVWQTLVPSGLRSPAARALFAPKQTRHAIGSRMTPEQKQRVKELFRR